MQLTTTTFLSFNAITSFVCGFIIFYATPTLLYLILSKDKFMSNRLPHKYDLWWWKHAGGKEKLAVSVMLLTFYAFLLFIDNKASIDLLSSFAAKYVLMTSIIFSSILISAALALLFSIAIKLYLKYLKNIINSLFFLFIRFSR